MNEAVIINSPLGHIRLIATSDALCHLSFTNDPLTKGTIAHPVLRQASNELAEYFGGHRKEFTVKLSQSGTSFQQKVWQELQKIPYGTAISYGELACRIDRPKASRAVGGANGRNNIAIIVPCHRVITHDQHLGGYASGPDHKIFLLDLENVDYKK